MRNCKRLLFLFLLAGVSSLCFAAPNPYVVLETNFGNIVIELYPDQAPVTVDNFLGYVHGGFYNGLLFHRAENRDEYGDGLDVIQGGACYYYEEDFHFPPVGNPIVNESNNGLSNVRGTIAMARSTEPHSATAQFYINHQDNTELDRANYWDGYGYCVFGAIVEGIDVVDEIAAAPTVNLQTINPDWPPYTYFPNPIIGMYSVYVLPCNVSYCSDLAGAGRIDFEDFAMFASRWLDDVCGSDNDFCSGSDLNYNGMVNIIDLELFIEHWTRIAGHEPYFSDLVFNNAIDFDDLTTLMTHWLDSGCDEANQYCGGADIDRNGTVDLVDYSLLSNNWLGSY